MADFKPKAGEFVQLTTGGPKMVVDRRIDDTTVECSWSEGKKVRQQKFSDASLRPYRRGQGYAVAGFSRGL